LTESGLGVVRMPGLAFGRGSSSLPSSSLLSCAAGSWSLPGLEVVAPTAQPRHRNQPSGTPGAARNLADLLETHGQVEQAERMRSYGLNSDGSIASAPDSEAGMEDHLTQ
jgi:hypothetical protein